jgi:tetratricopeptide (TPR) repeat protein
MASVQGTFRLLVCASLLLAGGCAGTLPPSGVALLQEVENSYRHGDCRGTISKADEFIALHGGTEPAGEAFYLRGLAYASLKDRKKARENFEQAIVASHRADLAPLAHVALGNLAFEDGQLDQAAAQYRPVIDQLPNEAPKDQVLYRLGQCYARLGQWRAGQTWFSQLTTLFPASALEPLARRYLACDSFSVQCGAYLTAAEANAKVAELAARKFANVHWVQDPRMKYHLVQVGSFKTYDEAKVELARLQPITEAMIVP